MQPKGAIAKASLSSKLEVAPAEYKMEDVRDLSQKFLCKKKKNLHFVKIVWQFTLKNTLLKFFRRGISYHIISTFVQSCEFIFITLQLCSDTVWSWLLFFYNIRVFSRLC